MSARPNLESYKRLLGTPLRYFLDQTICSRRTYSKCGQHLPEAVQVKGHGRKQLLACFPFFCWKAHLFCNCDFFLMILEPASSEFPCHLKMRSSPGVLWTFSTKLGPVGHPGYRPCQIHIVSSVSLLPETYRISNPV